MTAMVANGRLATCEQRQQPERKKADGNDDLPGMKAALDGYFTAFGTGDDSHVQFI